MIGPIVAMTDTPHPWNRQSLRRLPLLLRVGLSPIGA